MAGCCPNNPNDEMFNPRIARRELARYRKRGPAAPTRQLLEAIEAASPPRGSTILDIGGGIGAIHHGLLDRGFATATQVDASSAYLSVAADEATRLGHADRVVFRHGDYHDVASQLPESDVVALDRVVCCDPDYEGMLGAAATHARRLLALSYPRPRLIVRAVVAVGNAWRRITRARYRTYVHPPEAMAEVLERHGLHRRSAGGTFVWAADVFAR